MGIPRSISGWGPRHVQRILVCCVANRPRFGCYSLAPTGAYWSLLMSAVISVSIRLPVYRVLSACYRLEEPGAVWNGVVYLSHSLAIDAIGIRQLFPTILCTYLFVARNMRHGRLRALKSRIDQRQRLHGRGMIRLSPTKMIAYADHLRTT